jgi:hypothetical protein
VSATNADTGLQLIAHAVEAVAAIDRAVAARAERYGSVSAAVAAHDSEGFSLSTTTTATKSASAVSRLASTRVTARDAAFGVVGETARRVKLLFTYGEKELGTAVAALKGHVGKGHDSSSGRVGNHDAHFWSDFVGQSDFQYPRKVDRRNLYFLHYTGNITGKQRL